MSEFYNDVHDKKLMADGARHKVRGGGAHRSVHFPSDNLTDAQIKRMSSGLRVYQMKKPTTWAGFKEMPDDIKKIYITGLIDRYNVTNSRLAAMFGASEGAVSMALSKLGIHRSHKHKQMTPEQIAAWKAFEVTK